MSDDTASTPDDPAAAATSGKPLTEPVRELLRRPNRAVIATVGRTGQPVTAATWYVLEDDDTLLFNIEEGRARIRHLAADPRFALTVLDENWYSHLSVQGHVVQTTDDTGLADIDRISSHYNGRPYPVRDQRRLSYRGVIDNWFGWHLD